MPNKKKTDYAPHIPPDNAPPCHVNGCAEAGTYKAPVSRDELHDYRWFCLDHIREHNQKWDFFSGMNSDQIEFFVRDAVTGHRPTWSRESRMRDPVQHLQDRLYEFLQGDVARKARRTPPLAAKIRKALATMDMEYPYTAQSLKVQYRGMVKKFHPDVNKGNKAFEEKFKQITSAYHILGEYLKNPPQGL